VVLSVSNWRFVRDAIQAGLRDFKPVTPQDFDVSIKISSTLFKTPDRGWPFFDKHGLTVGYPAMVSLLSDPLFHNSFLKPLKAKYEQDVERPIMASPACFQQLQENPPLPPSTPTAGRNRVPEGEVLGAAQYWSKASTANPPGAEISLVGDAAAAAAAAAAATTVDSSVLSETDWGRSRIERDSNLQKTRRSLSPVYTLEGENSVGAKRGRDESPDSVRAKKTPASRVLLPRLNEEGDDDDDDDYDDDEEGYEQRRLLAENLQISSSSDSESCSEFPLAEIDAAAAAAAAAPAASHDSKKNKSSKKTGKSVKARPRKFAGSEDRIVERGSTAESDPKVGGPQTPPEQTGSNYRGSLRDHHQQLDSLLASAVKTRGAKKNHQL